MRASCRYHFVSDVRWIFLVIQWVVTLAAASAQCLGPHCPEVPLETLQFRRWPLGGLLSRIFWPRASVHRHPGSSSGHQRKFYFGGRGSAPAFASTVSYLWPLSFVSNLPSGRTPSSVCRQLGGPSAHSPSAGSGSTWVLMLWAYVFILFYFFDLFFTPAVCLEQKECPKDCG